MPPIFPHVLDIPRNYNNPNGLDLGTDCPIMASMNNAKSLQALTWDHVGHAASAIGIPSGTSRKWRAKGRRVPWSKRLAIAGYLAAMGIQISLMDFDNIAPGKDKNDA